MRNSLFVFGFLFSQALGIKSQCLWLSFLTYECQKKHDILFGHWFLDVLNGSHDTSLNWYTWGHKNIWCNYVRKVIRALFQPFSHIYIMLCKGWGIQLVNHCECIELYSV
jgi:hypothetical protein